MRNRPQEPAHGADRETAGGQAGALPDNAALIRLLSGYDALLAEVARRRMCAALPRRLWAWSTERAANDYVRNALGLLQRRFAAHAALTEQRDESAAHGRERIEQFAASLPPPASRLRQLWMAAAVLVIAQLLLPLVRRVSLGLLPISGKDRDGNQVRQVATSLKRVADLNPNNVGDAITLVLRTNLLVTGLILAAVGVAAYLVLRPLANGAIELRVLRYGALAGRWPPFHARTRQTGARLEIRERERVAFGDAGIELPSDGSVDLLAKACLVVPLLVVGAAFWGVFVSSGSEMVEEGGDISPGLMWRAGFMPDFVSHRAASTHAWMAVVAGFIGVARLAWLALEGRRRNAARWSGVVDAGARSSDSGARNAVVALAVGAIVSGAGFAFYARWDHRPPDVWLAWRKLSPTEYQAIWSCSEPCDAGPMRVVSDWSGHSQPPTFYGEDPPDSQLGGSGYTENSGASTQVSKRVSALFLKRSTIGPDGDPDPDLAVWRPVKPLHLESAELSKGQLRWLHDAIGHDMLGLESLRLRVTDGAGNATDLDLPLGDCRICP